MFRARNWKRFAVVVLVVGGVVLIGGKLLLRSAFAADQVRARLGVAVGAPVRFSSFDLGFTGSSLGGIEIDQVGASSSAGPWLTIKTVDANLSLVQLLRGNIVDSVVTLRDANVTLQFDAEDRLLTRLPTPPGDGPMPTLRLEGGTFTLKRDGRPDELFRNIKLEVRNSGPQLLIAGTIDDPEWGPWKVEGSQSTPTAPFALNLKTRESVHVTPGLLRRTPFVGPHVWRQVTCEGDTPCEVAVQFNPAPPNNYRVVLEPRNTKVYVPSIDLSAEAAQGSVVIADDVLTLENVRGKSSGGDLKLGSVMDFRNAASDLKFTIEAGLLALNRLPKTWNVPALHGEVTGKADLQVVVRNGRSTTRGQGEGSIRMFPLLRPIKLQLTADDKGIHFNVARN